MENKVELTRLPTSFIDRVAIDELNGIIYLDKRYDGHPLFLSWVEQNKSSSFSLTIELVDVDEIAKLRSGGMRVTESADSDMVVRGNAISMIEMAAAYGSSDMHFMLRGEYTEIQIVIKGELRVLTRKTQSEGEDLVRSIYQGIAKTRDASYNALDFQNAQIPGDALPSSTNLTSIRIVRGPSYPQSENGSFMTMRLQYASGSAKPRSNSLKKLLPPRKPDGEVMLQEMGYTADQVEKIRLLMDSPSGVVIFTGPTGSGKTTTMFEALKESARIKPHRRLVTVEDPVEYPMWWAVQMAITGTKNDAETGAAFGERIRVALRMAPHALFLGELRGPDVAVAALEAAVTGHQVWTTMHVTDPFLFVERLELMDRTRLDRRIFCDHQIVRGVIAQRLIPKLCPDCSVLLSDSIDTLPKRTVSALKEWGDISRVRVCGPGCETCGLDGTLGRFAIAEVVVMNAAVMRDFIDHGSETARDNYRKQPGADKSMMESAIDYALRGEIDPRAIGDSIGVLEAPSPKLQISGV